MGNWWGGESWKSLLLESREICSVLSERHLHYSVGGQYTIVMMMVTGQSKTDKTTGLNKQYLDVFSL